MEVLSKSGQSTVFRAIRNGQEYAIKIFKTLEHGSFRQFRKEASSIARIHHSRLVKVIEGGESDGQPYLVTELVKGHTLATELENGPLSSANLIQIAKELTEVLIEIHRRGMVHRDIKPANIIVEPTHSIKLIDLGLAISHERDPDDLFIAGTFLYSSPEQIGMLKHPIDGRSDLYSLGCVLFECATGQVPYNGRDFSELLYLLSSQPIPDPRQIIPNLSRVLSAIIQKLLSKDPADRYSNSLKLLADLDRIQELEKHLEQGEELQLGTYELEVNLEMPLIGRDEECEKISRNWKLSAQNKGRILFIKGPPGSGKSRIAREGIRIAKKDKATILTGKATLGASIPFGTLRDVIDKHLREIRFLPQKERVILQDRIKTAIGELAPLLKCFSSEIKILLQDVKDVLEVQSPEVFYEAMATFINRLSKELSPLLIFLDDIQWLDEASREVLVRLSMKMKESAILIIAACRSEEKEERHFKDLESRINSELSAYISVPPMNALEVKKMAYTFLGDKTLPQGGFIEKIVQLSQGNPLIVSEYLLTLLDSGCLYPTWEGWTLDVKEIDQLKFASSLIDIILQRIYKLGEYTQKILKLAAVLGSQFEKDVLGAILNQDVSMALNQGVVEHLIESVDKVQFAFVHDRVQEALLSRLSENELKEIHQRAAEVLDNLPLEKKQDKKVIFSLARHYMYGFPEKNSNRTYETNFEAGVTAMLCFSYQEAKEFFECAANVIPMGQVKRDMIPLLKYQAEIALKQNNANLSIMYLTKGLALTQDRFQRAQLNCQIIEAEYNLMNLIDMEETYRRSLTELGLNQKRSSIRLLVSILKYACLGFVLRKTGWFFGSAKGEKVIIHRLLCRLHDYRKLIASGSNQIGVLFDLTFKQMYSAHLLGLSPELASAYASYALVLGGLHQTKAARKYCEMSLSIAQQFGDPTFLVKTRADVGMAYFVMGDHLRLEKYIWANYESDRHWLSGNMSIALCGPRILTQMIRGYVVDSIFAVNEAAARLGDPTEEISAAIAMAGRIPSLAFLGRISEAIQGITCIKEGKIFKSIFKNEIVNTILVYGYVTGFYMESEDVPNFEHSIENFEKLKLNPYLVGPIGWHYYVFHVIARGRQFREEMRTKGKVDKTLIRAFKKASRDLSKFRVPILIPYHQLAKGILAWSKGNLEKALKFFNEAEYLSLRYDIPLARFETLLQRTVLYQQLKASAASNQDLKSAVLIAKENSWKQRLRYLKGAFQLNDPMISQDFYSAYHALKESTSEKSSTKLYTSFNQPASDSYQIYKLKRHLDALLQINRAAAKFNNFRDSTRAILDEVIKILNAERALLLVVDDMNHLQILVARNAGLEDLPVHTNYSKTLVDQVYVSRLPIIVGRNEDVNLSQSAIIQKLRSAMAVPLLKEGNLIGILYADSTIARGLFQEDDLGLLDAISGYLAVSFEAARSRQLEAEKDLLKKEQELNEVKVKTAHAAGMAEIATGIIHSIGNTLTTVTSYFDIVAAKMNDSKIQTLSEACKAISLLKDQLQEPLSVVPNGIPLLNLIIKLGEVLSMERKNYLEKFQLIDRGLKAIKDIIVAQQEYAQTGLYQEEVDLAEFVNEILNLQNSRLRKSHIQVERSFSEVPHVFVQKNKLLNVLLNLINNAKDAMAGMPEQERVLKVSLSQSDKECQIKVTDSGVGILAEDIQKVFIQDFDSKKRGYTFGLHMSANAVTEIGGTLQVESQGIGKGASFTINLPKSKNAS